MSFRSLLFAPAVRPNRFDRAIQSGADAVCLDLEDSCPLERKAEARDHVAGFLAARAAGGDAYEVATGVRINDIESPWWQADLDAAARADFILIPKVSSTRQLSEIVGRVGHKPIWALIETARGLRKAWEVASSGKVAGVMFGAFDFAADMGCAMEWEALLFARAQIAVACAAASIEAMDSPSGDVGDISGVGQEASRIKALGFTGKACIHPGQVGPVNRAFTPTEEEVAEAHEIVAAFEAAAGGAAQRHGKLIERPVAFAAQRVLSRRRS